MIVKRIKYQDIDWGNWEFDNTYLTELPPFETEEQELEWCDFLNEHFATDRLRYYVDDRYEPKFKNTSKYLVKRKDETPN